MRSLDRTGYQRTLLIRSFTMKLHQSFCYLWGLMYASSRKALRRLVAYVVSKDLDMVSVLPTRGATADSNSLFQIIRYWWELAIPSILRKQRPPVLSSCWLVRKSAFKKLGGFGAYRRSVKPEAHFAKRFGDRYAFVRSSSAIEVESVKNTKDNGQPRYEYVILAYASNQKP